MCNADSDAVASKMESGFSTPFDTEMLPRIPVPRSPKERTCAWLNSTHLPRRTGPSPAQHIDEFAAKTVTIVPLKLRERNGWKEMVVARCLDVASPVSLRSVHTSRSAHPGFILRWMIHEFTVT